MLLLGVYYRQKINNRFRFQNIVVYTNLCYFILLYLNLAITSNSVVR